RDGADVEARRRLLRPCRIGAPGGGRSGGARARVTDAPPVAARALVKRYGELVAVDHVDLTVEPGDVFGYLGPNGAGKTTSLRMLLGLIRPSEGRVELFGRDPLVHGVKALEGVAGFAGDSRARGSRSCFRAISSTRWRISAIGLRSCGAAGSSTKARSPS